MDIDKLVGEILQVLSPEGSTVFNVRNALYGELDRFYMVSRVDFALKRAEKQGLVYKVEQRWHRVEK